MNDWRKELGDFFDEKSRLTAEEEELDRRHAEARKFYERAVLPAFEEMKKELEKHSRTVRVSREKEYVSFRVRHGGFEEYRCDLKIRIGSRSVVPYAVRFFVDKKSGRRRGSEAALRADGDPYSVRDFSKIDIIRFVLKDYKSFVV